MTSTAAPSGRVLLPPAAHRWRTAVLAPLAAVVPTAVATLWLASQGGHLTPALTLVALLLAAAAGLAAAVLRLRVELLPDGLLATVGGRTRRVERDAVKRAVIRTVTGPDGIRSSRHLFLLDADARTVLRMSSRWWTPVDLDRVARHLEVPLETPTEVVGLADLRRSVPGQLRWTERHPGLTLAIVLAVGYLGCLVVGGLAASSL